MFASFNDWSERNVLLSGWKNFLNGKRKKEKEIEKEKKKEEEETISSKRSKLLNVLLNRSLERVRQDSLVCVTSYKASSSTETTSCSR